MGWDWGYLNGRTPKQEILRNHEHTTPSTAYRVLAYATVGSTVYLAQEETDLLTGERAVRGVVVLTQRAGGQFGTKSMREEMGPADSNAPAKVLDLLTPTTDAFAMEWRKRCRANTGTAEQRKERRQRAKGVVVGMRIRLAEPITLPKAGVTTTDLRLTGIRANLTVFEPLDPHTGQMVGSTYVRIPDWRDRDWQALPD